MGKVIIISLLLLTAVLWRSDAFALSEYGRKCDDNLDCVKCRDENKECSICMNSCWDRYGPAEVDSSRPTSRDRTELCRIRRAKWCNAQCWDPDDKKNPDYVSTKPDCGDPRFPVYKSRKERPW